MKLVEINDDNYKRLSALYDGIEDRELSTIINNHLKVIIDEIEEDSK